MSVFDLIRQIVSAPSAASILGGLRSDSERGFYFERLWDIVIRLGFIDRFPKARYQSRVGNINTGEEREWNLTEWLRQPIRSGNTGGVSDITLFDLEAKMPILMSSKYPKAGNDPPVTYYDIQNILAVTLDRGFDAYEIYLLVPSRENVLAKVKEANRSSRYVTKYMTEDHILDLQDLEVASAEMRRHFGGKAIDLPSLRRLARSDRLRLRFHQRLFIHRTLTSPEKRILWGAKCRSGKTYMAGGLIVEMAQRVPNFRALVITPAPTETLSQFTTDLFHKFADFDDFTITELPGPIPETTPAIFVASKQYLQGHLDLLLGHLSLLIFDENHYGGTTELSQSIIETYADAETKCIFLTATYRKTLEEYQIETPFIWDIEDERLCQGIALATDQEMKDTYLLRLAERHTAEAIEAVAEGYEDFEPYLKMPGLVLLTNLFDREYFETLRAQLPLTDQGFSFEALFALHRDGRFIHDVQVRHLLDYIRTKVHPRLRDSRPVRTQLWFLPEKGIAETSAALEAEMKTLPYWDQYTILSVNAEAEIRNVKAHIAEAERRARKTAGLVILAGKMLSLGITIESCDAVFLLHGSRSPEKVIQQMFRCLTEGPGKTLGFAVDFNPGRVLETVLTFGRSGKPEPVADEIDHAIRYNLLQLDRDFEEPEETTIAKLLDIWKESTKSLDQIRRLIVAIHLELATPIQEEINRLFHAKAEARVLATLVEEPQELPRPKKATPARKKKEEPEGKEAPAARTIDFTREVLPYVLPLTCLLTLGDENREFLASLRAISQNPELYEIFEEQCQIWWPQAQGFLDVIRRISEGYIGHAVDNITLQIKLKLADLLDSPAELLEMINACLVPNQQEKEANGEVFTPIKVIESLLDKLPVEVFEDPSLKWFDPAAGMGNFPVCVYLRLFKGLEAVFPDREERKRHIIEEMLFASELNRKNAFVLRQIFNAGGQYRLRLHCGDTLTMDPQKEWGVDAFDIIMGNPPYNKGGIRSHTGKKLGEKNETIWPTFVEYALRVLKPLGHLVYITPLSWLNKTHSLHEELLGRYIKYLELWDNAKAKDGLGGEVPVSLYVLQNGTHDGLETEVRSVLRRLNIDATSRAYLDPHYSIPLGHHSIFAKLRTLIEKHGLQLEVKSKTVQSYGDRLIYRPGDHFGEGLFGVDTYTLAEGIQIKPMAFDHPDRLQRKLIIANKMSLKGAFIDEGRLGLVGNHKYYITGERLEVILATLGFKLVAALVDLMKYNQQFLDRQVFAYIPDLRKLGREMSEAEFYEMLGLTDEERLQCGL